MEAETRPEPRLLVWDAGVPAGMHATAGLHPRRSKQRGRADDGAKAGCLVPGLQDSREPAAAEHGEPAALPVQSSSSPRLLFSCFRRMISSRCSLFSVVFWLRSSSQTEGARPRVNTRAQLGHSQLQRTVPGTLPRLSCSPCLGCCPPTQHTTQAG